MLVIDDEAPLENVYRNFLAKLNAEVTFCEHPQKSLAAMARSLIESESSGTIDFSGASGENDQRIPGNIHRDIF